MKIIINIPVDSELVHSVIEHVLSFLNEDDINTLKYIYVKEKTVIEKTLPYVKIRWDAWYARDKNGSPTIVITYERLLKKRKSIWRKIVLIPVFFILLLCLPIAVYVFCVRSKNYKIWLLVEEYKIPYRLKMKTYSYMERKLVATILFYVGIHIYYNIYNKNGNYIDLNIYEKAAKYRDEIIKRYEPLYIK